MTTQTQGNGESVAAPSMEGVGIHSRAMLVSVSVSAWAARRFDRQVTEEVNREHAASKDAGRYNKHLFADAAPSHKAACNAAGAVRGVYYSQTLPWTDENWRLLPSANFFAFTEALRAACSHLDTKVGVFADEYLQLVEDAKAALNGLWRAEDYPSVYQVRERFGVVVKYAPVPSAGDFRLDLPADKLAEIEQAVTERVRHATDEAMRDAWNRLYAGVQRLYARLSARNEAEASGDENARMPQVRDSLVENLRETVDLLARLNVTEDPALEAMRQRVLDELTQIDAGTLRKDGAVRTDTAEKAAAILDAMSAFYGGGAEAARAEFDASTNQE